MEPYGTILIDGCVEKLFLRSKTLTFKTVEAKNNHNPPPAQKSYIFSFGPWLSLTKPSFALTFYRKLQGTIINRKLI